MTNGTTDPRVEFFRRLRPKTDPVKFCRPARDFGAGLLAGPDADKGCGHTVRLVYMTPSTSRRPMARSAICPICGRDYVFAYWKLNSDREYVPSAEEIADIRALYADLKRMAKGGKPTHNPTLTERIRVHCLRARLSGDGTCDCTASSGAR